MNEKLVSQTQQKYPKAEERGIGVRQRRHITPRRQLEKCNHNHNIQEADTQVTINCAAGEGSQDTD